MRRTLEGTKRKRQRKSGFLERMSTPNGRNVLNRRRAKGRHKIAIVAKNRA
ncbi:MAG: 50S ribosomal protein L34 [Candidatus Melainabacteria bacterium GWF2_32_7]|nr:MAG: 50S ribosomal protein L34 [Candidatus Melainabacteria bacterium GWF2_32_7]OGI22901.1 MAG: 50S ribosomal protein L34 [Candidatus Melainabacteria bacterium RIFOXYA2_FULL_32_9]